MAHKNKRAGQTDIKTGNDFIEKARSAGASIRDSKRKGFTEVSTPAGTMFIAPGDQPLDYRTRKNLKHWLRLLGLLSIIGMCIGVVDFFWGLLHLAPLF